MAASGKKAAQSIRFRGRNVLVQAAAPEKEKVSITLDKALVAEIRAQFAWRALSASINELLYAALAQLSERGYHATGLKEVAERCEFSVGSIYQFFDSKDTLYEAVLV
jgi:hypothetical protein